MAPRAATSASQTDGELPKIRHSNTELLLLCVNCQVLDHVANPNYSAAKMISSLNLDTNAVMAW